MPVALPTDFNIDPNTTNGTQLADILNRLHNAGLTAHSGATRPAYAQPGTIWLDSSAAPILKWFDGANDVQLASVSASVSFPVGNPVVGTDALNLQTGDARYVKVAGDSMAGDLTFLDTPKIQLGISNHGMAHIKPIAPAANMIGIEIGAGVAAPFAFNCTTGSAYAPVSWVGASDRRLKGDIAPLQDALNKVLALTGCTFKRVDLNNRQFAGVIAQDVQAVLPEGVSEMGGEKNYLAVDPMPLIGLLVEAVKELTNRVAVLESKGP